MLLALCILVSVLSLAPVLVNAADVPKDITSVELTIETPLCGTVVSTENIDDWPVQDPYPVVTFPDGAEYEIALQRGKPYCFWINSDDFDTYANNDENPKMTGGEVVRALLYVRPKEGHGFADADKLSVCLNGFVLQADINAEYIANSYYYDERDNSIRIFVDVEAAHVPGETAEVPGKDPKCLEDGYHYEVTCCEKCGEELKREKVTDPALGHDWGDWELTTEEEGVETRICKRDPSHKEKRITSVDLTIEAPLCGTVVTAEVFEMDDPEYPTVKAGTDGDDKAPVYYYWDTQNPHPVVTIPDGVNYMLDESELYLYGHWLKPEGEGFALYVNDENNPMMTGGDTVKARIYVVAKEGYDFAPYVEVKVNGGKLVDVAGEDFFMAVLVDVEVEHVPGEPSEEPGVDSTCLEPGYHYEVTCCEKCGEELKREKVTDPALGHDWGEWKVTKEPTDDEKGEETRVCKRDPSHIETRPLDKDSESPDTSDSGRIVLWSALSAASLASLVWLDKERRKYADAK